MLWVGLTGGLGSGKSSVAQILRNQGFTVVDADELARQAVGRGEPGLTKVQARFGSQILNSSGELDRARLAEMVFADPKALADLEQIIHPIVRARCLEKRVEAESSGAQVAFYDVPLLFEKKMEDQFDSVVVVACSEEEQVRRAMAREGVTREKVLQRLKNQIPLNEKILRADYVVDNSGSREDLEREVQKLIQNFKN